MNSSERIQAIFDREIERLDTMSKTNALDIADILRLEKLMGAYSRYKDQRLASPNEYDNKSTDDLLRELHDNPTRENKGQRNKGRVVEEGGTRIPSRPDTSGDEESV